MRTLRLMVTMALVLAFLASAARAAVVEADDVERTVDSASGTVTVEGIQTPETLPPAPPAGGGAERGPAPGEASQPGDSFQGEAETGGFSDQGTAPAPAGTEPEQARSSNRTVFFLFLMVVALLGGGAFAFFKTRND